MAAAPRSRKRPTTDGERAPRAKNPTVFQIPWASDVGMTTRFLEILQSEPIARRRGGRREAGGRAKGEGAAGDVRGEVLILILPRESHVA